MGRMQREKGKRGEREVAALIRGHGFEAWRGQQFRGGEGSPDIVHNIPNVHMEVKFREQFSLYPALEETATTVEAIKGNMPVVFHRRKTKPWVVVMYAEDYLNLVERIREWEATEYG